MGVVFAFSWSLYACVFKSLIPNINRRIIPPRVAAGIFYLSEVFLVCLNVHATLSDFCVPFGEFLFRLVRWGSPRMLDLFTNSAEHQGLGIVYELGSPFNVVLCEMRDTGWSNLPWGGWWYMRRRKQDRCPITLSDAEYRKKRRGGRLEEVRRCE